MSQIKIGWAQRDVSTDKPVNIPGQFHMRISQGVMDPLFVSALAVDDGKDAVIFLSADLVVIRSYLLDEIRAKVVKKDPSIDAEKILMNATHTHTGASHYSDTGWIDNNVKDDQRMPNPGINIASGDEYRDFLSSQAADAVCEAWTKRAPGGIAYGYGYAVVSHSRRVLYFDDTSKRPGSVSTGYMVNGHAVMYGNTNDENFSGYEAGSDHFINILYTFDTDRKLTGAIINVPSPSQNSEHEHRLSADFWHDVRREIRSRHGDIFILPQCAAGGDLSPRILHYKKAQDRRFRLKYGMNETELAARRDIAERISAAFDEVLSWAKNDIKTDVPVKHRVETVMLSKRPITDGELAFCTESLNKLRELPFKTEGGTPTELLTYNSSLQAQRSRFERIIQRYEDYESNPKLPMELHVLNIGDIAFASNRFELYMDFMHRIQARSPFEQTFVIQLAGMPGPDGGSYLATRRGAENKGYSACLFCNVVSPEGGQELVEETLRILREIKETDK
ncbi:MAG: hypothetical protein PHZ09_03030 [Eubacteriales bacterium]|nr:hypothetical protein [Eubacteriales bacterium]